MWVGTLSGVTSAGMVISSARGGTLDCKKKQEKAFKDNPENPDGQKKVVYYNTPAN